MAKKSPDLANLVTTKGAAKAVPAATVPARSAAAAESGTATADLEPLNFKVPAEFRKKFRTLALEHDLKLNGLLFAAVEAFEKSKRGNHV